MNYHNVEFIKSAAAASGFISDGLPQIVFSGRSNVGKSSVINRLLIRKNLARVSSTPGKTIHINYFLIDNAAYFVDLPGYGYAKVAKTERGRWAVLMEAFFSRAGHITLGIMIVDARHKPTDDDVTMAEWFKSTGCPVVVIANKVDKVKSSEKEQNIALIRETLGFPEGTQVLPFSAEKGTNREFLLAMIEQAVKEWYNV
jgi:GTP-binding protein